MMSNTTSGAADASIGITEQNIAHWDAIFRSRSWGRYPPEELIRFVARTYRDPPARRHMQVLEVGCGPGPNLWYLAREGFAVAGIDGSPHAIAAARERLRAEGLTGAADVADLRTGNFASLPWPAETFDAVIDIEAIYANTRAVIASAVGEAWRVLRPGGWLFGKMFGPETTGARSGQILEPGTSANPTEGPLAGTGLTHVFTRIELTQLLARFSEHQLDWVRRSDRNGRYTIFEWLVQARK